MIGPATNLPWYAIHVRSRQERVVASMLRHKGYAEYLPLHQVKRKWSDRVKKLELPLFPSYVFCQMQIEERLPVLMIPGVVSIVGAGKTPIPVDPEEFNAIKTVERSGLPVEGWRSLRKGDVVEVEDGPLAGVRGSLIEFRKQRRLLVSVTLLQRTVAVEIEEYHVRPVFSSRGHQPPRKALSTVGAFTTACELGRPG